MEDQRKGKCNFTDTEMRKMNRAVQPAQENTECTRRKELPFKKSNCQ